MAKESEKSTHRKSSPPQRQNPLSVVLFVVILIILALMIVTGIFFDRSSETKPTTAVASTAIATAETVT